MINLCASIVTGIVRFIIYVVISLFSACLIQYPLIPAWGEGIKFMLFDSVFRAYCSLIYMHHLHNNPVLLTFAKFMKKQKRHKAPRSIVIIRNKFYLIYFMTKWQNLELEKFRKKKEKSKIFPEIIKEDEGPFNDGNEKKEEKYENKEKNEKDNDQEENKSEEKDSYKFFDDSKDLFRNTKDPTLNVLDVSRSDLISIDKRNKIDE